MTFYLNVYIIFFPESIPHVWNVKDLANNPTSFIKLIIFAWDGFVGR